MPPLSEYKPQQMPEPLEIAIEQLDVAVDLFLSERSFVAALTLAGAAEAILSNALRRKGEETAVETEFADHDEIEQRFAFFGIYPTSASPAERWSAFREFKYRGINYAKHGPGRIPNSKLLSA